MTTQMQITTDPLGVLGQPVRYTAQYEPNLLFPLARQPKRQELATQLSLKPAQSLPFIGADLWTAYELSWLNAKGKPQIALANIVIPAETPNIIESKSFKLYLGSFSQTVFESLDAVREALRKDLGAAAWRGSEREGSVGVRLTPPDGFDAQRVAELTGQDLDRLDIDCEHYTPAPQHLVVTENESPVTEVLSSKLLKSNCLMTGQPDWGSVQIAYTGAQIDQAGLLRYLISFRQHNEFHEQCVERIFMDIWQRCKPLKLSVYARYTRRGGLDISPWRSSHPQAMPPNVRTARQ
jgi:7-cyano-7-deazaguanine reductase